MPVVTLDVSFTLPLFSACDLLTSLFPTFLSFLRERGSLLLSKSPQFALWDAKIRAMGRRVPLLELVDSFLRLAQESEQ